MKHKWWQITLRGSAMGVAETIPGVSAGTIAFITGIYRRLIGAIGAFDAELFRLLKHYDWKAAWNRIDGNFIVYLLSGMVIGLGLGIFGVSYLLENYPPVIWAFFLGLVIASIAYVARQITHWNLLQIILLILAAVLAFLITQLPMGRVNGELWFVFICGTVAISAMLLPGISGSFILLILGMYQFILHDTLKDGVLSNQDPEALLVFGVFALGCIGGLFSFARILKWAFNRYENRTLAALTGFLLGSAYKLWPWRIPTLGLNENDELIRHPTADKFDKVIEEALVLPNTYVSELSQSNFLMVSIGTFLLGIGIVWVLARVDEKI
jgi:putative membrane protein